MRDNRILNGIDGSLLFEKLCGLIGKKYLGDGSESYVLGSSNQQSIEKKITELIVLSGEGGSFRPSIDQYQRFKDDHLDVAIWKSFYDRNHGKLLLFGQCKTGVSWNKFLNELTPNKFCKNWFTNDPAVDPVPVFFITDCPDYNEWYRTCSYGGIVFNRNRIMNYFPDEIEVNLLDKIKEWNNLAMKIVKRAYLL